MNFCFNSNHPSLVTISSSSNMPAATAASSKQAVDPLLDNTDLLGLATNELFSQLHDELNMACGGSGNSETLLTDSDSEELDTPLNIKENITLSLRNLNQSLDPLRGSSDDEEVCEYLAGLIYILLSKKFSPYY